MTSSALIPPAAPETTTGVLSTLRSEMARFSDTTSHPARRAQLEACVASVGTFPFQDQARRRAANVLKGAQVNAIAELAFVIPTDTFATALQIEDDELGELRSDVKAVVEVIGRHRPSTAAANDAASRLLERFQTHASGPVAAISLLYQNHDATAALVASMLLARHERTDRRSALARTVRVATEATKIGETEITPGSLVELNLETSRFEFGVGPHHCPGQPIAESIVAGILEAVDAADYQVVSDLVELNPDGRAKELPMRP